MKRYLEVEDICPFLGRTCVRNGREWNGYTFKGCLFYDEWECSDSPCKIVRAVNKLLETEQEDDEQSEVIVPWNAYERTDNNARTETKE